MIRKNHAGEKYGRLTLLEFIGFRKGGAQIYKCKCDCGKIVNVPYTSRVTKSCGCLQKEIASSNGKKKTIGYGISSGRRLLFSYKSSAIKRKKQWNISDDYFFKIVKQNCHYCNREPSQIFKTLANSGFFIYNGIDRLDNSKGYVFGNCVSCCKHCNYIKRKLSYDEFIVLIFKIYNRGIAHITRIY